VAEPRAARAAASPRRAVIDSGPLIALFNAGDHWHAPVLAWLREHTGVRLVCTWPVLTEVCALLSRRLGNDAALDFLRWVQRGAIQVDVPHATTLLDVLAISERFAEQPFDLADASVAETAARLKIDAVVSIDSDFDVYRDKSGRRLANLLTTPTRRRR
jgi:predicted nucleic acid-binding protein